MQSGRTQPEEYLWGFTIHSTKSFKSRGRSMDMRLRPLVAPAPGPSALIPSSTSRKITLKNELDFRVISPRTVLVSQGIITQETVIMKHNKYKVINTQEQDITRVVQVAIPSMPKGSPSRLRPRLSNFCRCGRLIWVHIRAELNLDITRSR